MLYLHATLTLRECNKFPIYLFWMARLTLKKYDCVIIVTSVPSAITTTKINVKVFF